MYNKAVLMGRICNDPEVKTTPGGTAVLSFRIAVERAYQVKGEEKKTDFFNCVAWRNNADFIARFFGKGKMILVEGELNNRQYTDKSGNQQTVTELIVDSAHFTGESSGSGNRPPEPTEPPPRYAAKERTNPPPVAENFRAQVDDSDEEYPFD